MARTPAVEPGSAVAIAEGGLEERARAGGGRSEQVEDQLWVVQSDDDQGRADGDTDETEDEHLIDGQFREQRLGEGGHAKNEEAG